MALYAIGDLHLSVEGQKPMEVFGDNWYNHHIKIKENWLKTVNKDDTVMILGDISWAMNLKNAKPDIDFIDNLPGKKIFISGNHDYWWSSTSKLEDAYPHIHFLKNSFAVYKNIAICGSRGWLCPNKTEFTALDEKIYKRETMRLKLSLDLAKLKGFDEIICIMHYPPTNDKKESSNFTNLYKQYNVKEVYYAHLHGTESFDLSLKGNYDNIFYTLVSADYLDFKLYKVKD